MKKDSIKKEKKKAKNLWGNWITLFWKEEKHLAHVTWVQNINEK